MSNTPLVSVITPTFNRANVIHETIESVLAQTYTNWELLLIDDGSSDNTIELCESYAHKDAKIKSFARPENKPKGPGSCRNIGIEKSNGEYIIFLDSDDLLKNDCIEQRVQTIIQNNLFDFIVFYSTSFTDSQKLDLINTRPKNIISYEDHFILGGVPWFVLNPIWKSDVLKKIGGFNENLIDYDDWELHCRSILLGYKFMVIKDAYPDSFVRSSANLNRTNNQPINLIRMSGRISAFKTLIDIYFKSPFRSQLNDKKISNFIIKNIYLYSTLNGKLSTSLNTFSILSQKCNLHFIHKFKFVFLILLRSLFAKFKVILCA